MIAKLHIILKQQNAEHHKEAIYAAYGVTSSRDMTDAQISHLIGQLETPSGRICSKDTPQKEVAVSVQVADDVSAKKMRSNVLKLLTASPRSTNARQRGLGVPNDWAILNPFIVRHGHKLLFQMSAIELENFHRKLLAMRDSGWVYRDRPTEGVENFSQKPATQTQQRNYMIMPTAKVLS